MHTYLYILKHISDSLEKNFSQRNKIYTNVSFSVTKYVIMFFGFGQEYLFCCKSDGDQVDQDL